MTARDDLRRVGAEVRRELGIADGVGAKPAPGYPGLVDEVVFGRLWARPGLSLDDRMLSTLSALTSKQRLPQLSTYVEAALHIGMEPRLVQEVMIHCAMYAGLPTAENSLRVVGEVLEKRNLPIPDVALPEADLDQLTTMGRETMVDLHRDRFDGGYASPDSAAADLYGTAIQFLYGEIWNRPGITRRQRMICSVAAFTATGMETQQAKFFQSALNVGLDRAAVIEVIMQTGPYSGFPLALNALDVAGRVLDQ